MGIRHPGQVVRVDVIQWRLANQFGWVVSGNVLNGRRHVQVPVVGAVQGHHIARTLGQQAVQFLVFPQTRFVLFLPRHITVFPKAPVVFAAVQNGDVITLHALAVGQPYFFTDNGLSLPNHFFNPVEKLLGICKSMAVLPGGIHGIQSGQFAGGD